MGRYYRTKVEQKQKNQQLKNNSYKLSRPKGGDLRATPVEEGKGGV